MKHTEVKYLIILNRHNKHTHTNCDVSSGSLWPGERATFDYDTGAGNRRHTTSPELELHRGHLRKVSWSRVSLQKGRGRKRYFSSTRLWESQVNKDRRALGKGPLKIGTGYKARVCLNSSTSNESFFALFCFVIEVKELKQTEWLNTARGIGDTPDKIQTHALEETIRRCWVCTYVHNWHSDKGRTGAWFSLGCCHFLWKGKKKGNENIHYGVKSSSCSESDKNVEKGLHKTTRNFSSHVGVLQTKQSKY